MSNPPTMRENIAAHPACPEEPQGQMIRTLPRTRAENGASRRMPERPCGCFGALSTTPARSSLPRATVLAGLSLTQLVRPYPSTRGHQAKWGRLTTLALAAIIVTLSPERQWIRRQLHTWHLNRQIRDHDIVLRQLPMTTTWGTLAPFVASAAKPDHWIADGNHYIEFPARPDSSASAVAFMAYPFEAGLRFRGALVRESTGEVLLKVQG